MKNEKGITLMSLLTYIGIMLTVIVIIGRINATYRAGLDDIDDSNATASDYSKLNQCLMTKTKRTTNTYATLGEMEKDNESDCYKYNEKNIENNEGYSAMQFSDGDTIGIIGERIYFNNTKICDNVEKFVITPNDSSGITVKVKFKDRDEITQSYTYR